MSPRRLPATQVIQSDTPPSIWIQCCTVKKTGVPGSADTESSNSMNYKLFLPTHVGGVSRVSNGIAVADYRDDGSSCLH